MDPGPHNTINTQGEAGGEPDESLPGLPALTSESHVASSPSTLTPEPEPDVSCQGDKAERPTEHVVTNRETVTSIAAMYDLTPSELAQTNKLGMSRLVFPGLI